jgi:dUTP pyrophosphatase
LSTKKNSIFIKKISDIEDFELPKYQSKEASGVDLCASIKSDITIPPWEKEIIACGISVSMPTGMEAQVRPRSGLAFKHGITVLNTPGTIDSDYRGEIKVILFNHGKSDFLINNKDRIAQMILTPVIKMDLEETENLPETIRGEGGFGSTGK